MSLTTPFCLRKIVYTHRLHHCPTNAVVKDLTPFIEWNMHGMVFLLRVTKMGYFICRFVVCRPIEITSGLACFAVHSGCCQDNKTEILVQNNSKLAKEAWLNSAMNSSDSSNACKVVLYENKTVICCTSSTELQILWSYLHKKYVKGIYVHLPSCTVSCFYSQHTSL